ncbi:hypothetical protein [Nitrosovibrio sp. Nv6]|nr:hypothetical protein [Nitrosovibrio sp. Nv6]
MAGWTHSSRNWWLKYQRRLPGFDDHVISMYERGMSVAIATT